MSKEPRMLITQMLDGHAIEWVCSECAQRIRPFGQRITQEDVAKEFANHVRLFHSRPQPKSNVIPGVAVWIDKK